MDDDSKMTTRSFVYYGSSGPHDSDDQGTAPVAERHWIRKLLLLPVFVVAGILGMFFFIAFLVLLVLLAVGFGVRLWWLRRQLRESMATSGPLYREQTMESGHENTEVVEGEYVVLDTDDRAGTEGNSSAPDAAGSGTGSRPDRHDGGSV